MEILTITVTENKSVNEIKLVTTAACVLSEVSQEDQQKIDMFMQNQQLRGRRRMPRPALRPMGPIRHPARLIGAGQARSPALRHRPPFRSPIASRLPFGFSRSDVMPAGGMPPRQKILVNPHFRGPLAATVIQRHASPSTQPANVCPKLMKMELPRPHQQQHPQLTVKFTKTVMTSRIYSLDITHRTGPHQQ